MRTARRGHRLAPHRGAEAGGADPADGVPRDHPPGHRAGGRAVAGHPRRPRRRPGGPAHRRPAVRLPGVRGAVAQGVHRAVGGAGRPSIRLVVQRERGAAFVPAGYWDLTCRVRHLATFTATLVGLDGNRVATGKDFDNQARVTRDDVVVVDETGPRPGHGSTGPPTPCPRWTSDPTAARPRHRSSPPPSSRRAAASWATGRSCARPRASTKAATSPTCGPTRSRCRTRRWPRPTQVRERTATTTCPRAQRYRFDGPRTPRRPTRPSARPATGGGPRTSSRASSRAPTCGSTTWSGSGPWPRRWPTPSARPCRCGSRRRWPPPRLARITEWAASGRTITFPGYLRVYVEASDDPEADLDDRSGCCPTWPAGRCSPTGGRRWAPPSRRPATVGVLVKRLEALGIGRPSTWASIMQTIQDRGYVWKKGTALVPSWSAFAVVQPGGPLRRGGRLHLHGPHGEPARRDRHRLPGPRAVPAPSGSATAARG